MTTPRPRLPVGVVLVLALAALACSLVNNLDDFFELEGPEDKATDAFFFPTRTPLGGEATLPPPATPDAPLGLTLDEADDAAVALRPEFAADLALPALADATRYLLDVVVEFNGPESATMTGQAHIRYTNQTDAALNDIVLMLWPNHPTQYLGRMALGTVTVNGQPVTPRLEHDRLAARLPLAAPLAPGEQVEIGAGFTVLAAGGLERGARFGLSNGVLLAPSFYPLIPRRLDGDWETAPAPTGGDTTNSDTSFYAWRITAPAEMAVAATGTVVDSTAAGGTQTQVLVTGPVRDLALVVGPLEATTRVVDGITVTTYLLADHAGEANTMLDQAEAQLRTLQQQVGPYPFTELDIVDAPGAFGGIEYPALIFIGVVGNGFYEVANVHEVGHQWFYSLIGDDQLRQPWLDEAAASYTEVLYYEAVLGPEAAAEHLDHFWQYVNASQHPELPIGLPVAGYPDGGEYGLLVYGKGALFFGALRRELGDETFFDFLRAYYAAYRYGFATSQGFQAVAEETCACDLDDLFNLWVYEGGPVPRP